MRRFLRNILIAAFAILCFGCNQQEDPVNRGEYVVRLELCCGEAQVRATKPGEDAYNENLMQTVDCFLYKQGQTGSGAFLSKHYTLKTTTSSVVEFSMSSADFDALVADGSTCEVFVIANMPDGVTMPSVTSVANLKAIEISENFKTKDTLDYFVMSGQAIVTRSGNEAAGVVDLSRAGSKLTMDITTAGTFVEQRAEGDITWTSQPSAMKVQLYNCNSKSTIAATDGTTLFSYDKRTYKKGQPWYSYPRSWTDTNPFYIVVTLPWTRPVDPLNPSAGTKFQNCYYKIILNDDELNPNTWYHIKANIKVLGSFYEDTPTVTLPEELQYYAVEWKPGIAGGTAFNTDAVIKEARFLAVSQTNYIMDNVNTLSIPFSSSHDCEATVTQAKYYKYSGSEVTEGDLYPSGDSHINNNNPGGFTISCDGSNVVLTYNLKNDINVSPIAQGTFDFVEYRYTINLHHKGEDVAQDYYEIITVSQRPALVVTAEKNTIDGTNNAQTLFVNSNHTYTGWNDGWYATHGKNSGTGDSSSPYMYVVTASKSDDYIIGDPRTIEARTGAQIGMGGTDTQNNVHNDNNPVSATAPAFYVEEDGSGHYYATPSTAHTRKLTYYYPTNDGEEYKNMVSPSFRISSANSQLYGSWISKQQLIWRCATYQEYGYPAGRWRLPTYAELRFIAKLSGAGLINTMFTDGQRYWSADGLYTYNGSSFTQYTGTNTTGFGRCIYDEWYWSQSEYATLPDKYVFTWGDMPRENFK